MKEINVNKRIIHIGDIVNTIKGKARLDYVGRQAFTNWTLIEERSIFPFGRPICVEDNDLDKFVI